MKLRAINQAKADFDEAYLHALRVKSAKNFQEFRSAWGHFLLSTNRIYNRLQAGCKGDPFDLDWIARKKKERRDDPLLNYLDNARDEAEHGLGDLVQWNNGSFIVPENHLTGEGPKEGGTVHQMGDGSQWIRLEPGQTLSLNLSKRSGIHLTDIKTKYDKLVPVPTSHLGAPFINPFQNPDPSPHPLDCARLSLDYFQKLIIEAEGRVA